MRTFILILVASVSLSGSVMAEIYKWKDENGKYHFSDQKPTQHNAQKIEVSVNTYTSVSYDLSAYDTGEQVVMYSTSWCGFCKKARAYFAANGIKYTEYDIEKDAAAKESYDALDATGVPVILVGNKRMNGFSETGFKRIYD